MRALFLLSLLTCTSAWAKTYDAYRADYSKGAFCIAVAGACAAGQSPDNSFYQNPAALAFASPGEWVWDLDFNPSDNVEPGFQPSTEVRHTTFMGGVARMGETWGAGIALTARFSRIQSPSQFYTSNLTPHVFDKTNSTNVVRLLLPFSYRASSRLKLGMSLVGLYYHETLAGQGTEGTFSSSNSALPRLGLSFGANYEISSRWRIGTWLRSPFSYTFHQNITLKNASEQVVYNEDVDIQFPLLIALGSAIRPWEDSRSISFEIDGIGTTFDGLERTLDVFEGSSDSTFQRAKGRTLVFEPRIGWKSPWRSDSEGTYTLGAYYEPSRWDAIIGRFHAVGSIAYRWKGIEGIVALDFARQFSALQISFR